MSGAQDQELLHIKLRVILQPELSIKATAAALEHTASASICLLLSASITSHLHMQLAGTALISSDLSGLKFALKALEAAAD